jgi:hypothetical protein
MHFAAKHGELRLVQFLEANGADIDHKNCARETPLIMADLWSHHETLSGESRSHTKVIEYLVSRGAYHHWCVISGTKIQVGVICDTPAWCDAPSSSLSSTWFTDPTCNISLAFEAYADKVGKTVADLVFFYGSKEISGESSISEVGLAGGLDAEEETISAFPREYVDGEITVWIASTEEGEGALPVYAHRRETVATVFARWIAQFRGYTAASIARGGNVELVQAASDEVDLIEKRGFLVEEGGIDESDAIDSECTLLDLLMDDHAKLVVLGWRTPIGNREEESCNSTSEVLAAQSSTTEQHVKRIRKRRNRNRTKRSSTDSDKAIRILAQQKTKALEEAAQREEVSRQRSAEAARTAAFVSLHAAAAARAVAHDTTGVVVPLVRRTAAAAKRRQETKLGAAVEAEKLAKVAAERTKREKARQKSRRLAEVAQRKAHAEKERMLACREQRAKAMSEKSQFARIMSEQEDEQALNKMQEEATRAWAELDAAQGRGKGAKSKGKGQAAAEDAEGTASQLRSDAAPFVPGGDARSSGDMTSHEDRRLAQSA